MAGKLRVLQVLEATVGGTRRHLLDLCRGLPGDRFDLHVVCSLERNAGFAADLAPLQATGLTVTFLPLCRAINPVRDLAGLRALRRILRAWQPDIVHGHSAKGGFLARLAVCLDPGPAAVYTPHAFPFQMQVSGVHQRLYLALERWAGRHTDRLVAVSTGERDLALQAAIVSPERVVLIPNGVDATLYADRSSRAAVRTEWGVPPEALLVGVVAALTPQKNLAGFLHAAATLHASHPDTRFVIIGEGPQRGELEALAHGLGLATVCRFAGQRADVPRLLPALDLFVLPSLWEGLPYALLEAGAAGLPVVASDIAGNRDLIRAGETGWLARPGDPGDLAAQMQRALADPARQEVGERLQEKVRQEYSLAQMIARHGAMYETLRAGGSSSA